MWDRLIRAISCFVPVRGAVDVTRYEFGCPFCGRVSPTLDSDRYYTLCLWCHALVWLRLPGTNYFLGWRGEDSDG